MSIFYEPRFKSAAGNLPPTNPLFWEIQTNQSDMAAFHAANITREDPIGKGGPFGAQLWLVNRKTNEHVLIGTVQEPEDSNAVVSKGQASAHAEAESLSPEKRQQVKDFLKENAEEGWEVVQVSSAESCPSCRSKQVAFANELIVEDLITSGQFHVVFKATYDQTKEDAGFNDAPYDQTFRAIHELGVLSRQEGLFDLEKALLENLGASAQFHSGELIYTPVNLVDDDIVPDNVLKIMRDAGEQPVAVIVHPDGRILGQSLDERDLGNDGINLPEKTAIVRAIEKASTYLRDKESKFASWELEKATVYTNIRDIGPMAYSGLLWSDLSEAKVVSSFATDLVDEMAQEVPGISNRNLFLQVAVDYDSRKSPLSVVFNGDPEDASVAHLVWKARMQAEKVKNAQAVRMDELVARPDLPKVRMIDGTYINLSRLVETSEVSSDYDGAKGKGSKLEAKPL